MSLQTDTAILIREFGNEGRKQGPVVLEVTLVNLPILISNPRCCPCC